MKNKVLIVSLLLVVFVCVSWTWGEDLHRNRHDCQVISGRLTETLMDPLGAPADQLGRVIGNATGFLNGAETAIVLNIYPPGEDGTIQVDTINVFSPELGDTLITEGAAVFTPIPGTTNVQDDLILEIRPNQSTGRFAGATGTIHLEGLGFNVIPQPIPGRTQFLFRYHGRICGMNDGR